MVRNFITMAYRNLIRHRVFSFINIVGLAVGIAAALLLLQFVGFERSYDDFHVNAKNIYRLRHDSYKNGVLENSSAISYYGAAPAIKESFPEVVNVVRLHRADGMINYYTGSGEIISHHESKAFYTDSSFFSVFSFPLVIGNANHVLRQPGSVAVSESASKKYFGDENPIGRSLSLVTEWEGGQYVIDGVFKDIPENSHMKFDFLFSIDNLLHNHQFKDGAWYWWNFYNYVLLKPGTNPAEFQRKLPSVIDSHIGSYLKKINSKEEFILQPLGDIHLHSHIGAEIEANGDYKIVSFLLILSFFIVGIAWLNYINLSTAKSTERSREVGIRKALGSNKNQLVRQFLIESSLVTMLSIITGIVLFVLATPYFSKLLGKNLTFDLSGQAPFWISALGTIIAGSFLSGVYPAFVISSFRPLTALKGKFVRNASSARLRRGMVVFQFAASITLIIATLTIYEQLEFMRDQDLGMNIHQKVVLRAPKLMKGESYMNEMDYFKDKLKAHPEVISVTASSEVPGKGIFWSNEFRRKDEPSNVRRLATILAVDEDFIPTYDVKLVAGRNFSKDRTSEYGRAVIINESALKLLGLKDSEAAINQELVVGDRELKNIIGVVKDFHQESLKQLSSPVMIYWIPWRQDYLTVSIQGTNLRTIMKEIEDAYRTCFPENAFDYFFLDDQFNQQ